MHRTGGSWRSASRMKASSCSGFAALMNASTCGGTGSVTLCGPRYALTTFVRPSEMSTTEMMMARIVSASADDVGARSCRRRTSSSCSDFFDPFTHGILDMMVFRTFMC